ncbi:DUF1289 domain-containing protein [Cognatishimia maritima]|uniref:DUF1289 domain-containing protein n=1 Tax=Cognatishimia maritima TaxID=870908 RepID=A0A1M5JPU6_9RHOB|nr:DUF1289 domain-containing protein [Cognatishimia maritima]SHG42299.1 hypothetical protein SAMN04488044_0737 [Cognatishimia maritima]
MINDPKTPVWQRAEIASPCVQVCVIHPRERICTGCFRTIDEITQWSQLSDAERDALMGELPEREGLLKKRKGGRRARQLST